MKLQTLLRISTAVMAGSIGAVIVLPNFLASRTRSPVSRVKSDQRSLAAGIESYYVDHDAYPPMTPLRDFTKHPEWMERVHGENLSTIYLGDKYLHGLTTPVSYITGIYPDPFSPDKKLPFAYYKDENGWILYSPGPDGVYDITNPTAVYTSKESQPSTAVLLLAFDPTNGSSSSGDVWRVKQ